MAFQILKKDIKSTDQSTKVLSAFSNDIENRVRCEYALAVATKILQAVVSLFLQKKGLLTLEDCISSCIITNDQDVREKFNDYSKFDKGLFLKDLIKCCDEYDILFACDVLHYFFFKDLESQSLLALEKLKKLRNLHRHGEDPEALEVSLAVFKFLKCARKNFEKDSFPDIVKMLKKLEEEDAMELIHSDECVLISYLEEFEDDLLPDLRIELHFYLSTLLIVRAKAALNIPTNLPASTVYPSFVHPAPVSETSFINSTIEVLCDETLPRITLLVGCSGSGKTYIAQNIVHEWLSQKEDEKNRKLAKKKLSLTSFNLILFVNCPEVKSSVFDHWKNLYPHLEVSKIQSLKLLIIIDECDFNFLDHRNIVESIILRFKNACLLITSYDNDVDYLQNLISSSSADETQTITIPYLTSAEARSLAENTFHFLSLNEIEMGKCQSKFLGVSGLENLETPLDVILACIICLCAVRDSFPIPPITTRSKLVSQFFTLCSFSTSGNWPQMIQDFGKVALQTVLENIPVQQLVMLDQSVYDTHFYTCAIEKFKQDNVVSNGKLNVRLTQKCFLWYFAAELIATSCDGNSVELRKIQHRMQEFIPLCRRFKDSLLPLVNSLIEKDDLGNNLDQVCRMAEVIYVETESDPLEFWRSIVKETEPQVPAQLQALAQHYTQE